MFLSQSNIFISSPRRNFISSPVGYVFSPLGFIISPVENVLLGLTPGKFWKFGIFPGESSSPTVVLRQGVLVFAKQSFFLTALMCKLVLIKLN